MNTSSNSDIAPDRFEKGVPLRIAGLVERYACDSPQGIPGQWQRLQPYLGHIPGQVGKTAYGVVTHFDSENNMDYLCGVEVHGAGELPAGFQLLEIPAQKYVVFRHAGHVAGIRATLAAIWTKWFAASGYQSAQGPTFERYGPDFDSAKGLGGFEIWIPIKG